MSAMTPAPSDESAKKDAAAMGENRAPSRSPRSFRIPIKVKLAIAVIFLIGFTIATLSILILNRESNQLYDQTVRTGMISLAFFENSAREPILSDDTVRLNTMIREASAQEEFRYVAIVDRSNNVKAHSDFSLVGKALPEFKNTSATTKEGKVTYFDYKDESGASILNLSTPVTFQNKVLGTIHLGVSLDFINEQITKAFYFILFLSIFFIVLGVVVAVILGVGFSRPISRLVVATQEIAKGNFEHRVTVTQNDEIGDLASAFNFMSEELGQKEMMQKSFGQYVSPEVVEMIMADPDSQVLKGTKGDATVIFTDVRGFTSFSENRDPEEVVEALNGYFEIATKWILEYGGYVDKFIGDAVMGVFGVPVPRGDHAERAVRACFSMQKELLESAERGHELNGRIGIGVNSGVVTSGNIGSMVKTEYTVIGDNVNVASRLNGLADNGQVVISLSTYEIVKDIVDVEPRRARKVKGKSEYVKTFLLTDVR